MVNKKVKGVVIVVDMIEAFVRIGYLANPNVERIIPYIKQLLQRKVKEGWEVIFLADNHREDDKEFEMFPKHAVEGTIETQVVGELWGFVNGKNYIKKTRYSGLYRTMLKFILDKMEPQEIIVVGVYADICVLYTAADLRNRDYKVTIPKDCTMTLEGIDDMIFRHMKNILGVNVVEKQEEV